MSPLATTWVRLADLWVRADRVVGVWPDPVADAGLGGRWGSAGQRLMVCVALPTADDGTRELWQEAAICPDDRAEVVVGTLLDAIASPTAAAGAPRYVYPVERDGWVVHWQASTTLPQGPAPAGVLPGLARAHRRTGS